MLLDLGCKYVILGHSERRHTLGESDTFINQKVRVALAAGLDVILCVGETLDQREADQTEAVLDRQLIQGLAGLSAETLTRLTIAYEPVWAIGGLGHHATPQQAQEAHAVIRRRFGQMFGEKSAQTLAIQYGGSVKPENAAALLSRHGVDGALIGGASLHADQFLAIVRAGINEPQTEGEISMTAIAPLTTRAAWKCLEAHYSKVRRSPSPDTLRRRCHPRGAHGGRGRRHLLRLFEAPHHR